MGFWDALSAEAAESRTLILVAGAIVAGVLLRSAVATGERARIRAFAVLTALHVVLLPIAAGLRAADSEGYDQVRLLSIICAAMAAIAMAGGVLFSVLLPRTRVVVVVRTRIYFA